MSRLTLSKRIAFSLVLIAFLLVVLELASIFGYGLLTGETFSWSAVQADRAVVIEQFASGTESGWEAAPEVVHPFVGFVSNPDRASGLSQYGYPKSSPMSRERRENRVVIAVVGGSVAQGFAANGLPAVIEGLKADPAFADREIVAVDLAVGGYKQPQQLMTMAYLLTLGFEFDVVVNIDGFNEVALHQAENGRNHVFPAFPRGWYLRVANVPNRALRARMGRVANLEESMLRSAEIFSASPWRWSIASNLVWRLRQDWMSGEHAAAFVALTRYQPTEDPYLMTGPRVDFESESELYEHLVAIWQRSSLQLDRLCRANGIRYFHFLQPNQYVEGSKPLTPQERDQAFTDDHPYRKGVELGYPLLSRAGVELRERGVRFEDLTQAFADRDETLYVDDCCHFNEAGNRVIAEFVTRAMLDQAG